jgi:lipopolysaccharide transport system ATP-binding protein
MIIKASNVTKKYRIGEREEQATTIFQFFKKLLSYPIKNYRRIKNLSSFKGKLDNIHTALNNVSFEIDSGDVIGVIGRNGAGKSTLLKILSRITDPTDGEIVMHGRLAALLEVGTGFHPELTGRENVFLNATILGMSKKEVESKFDEILEFSGLDKYIDTPVKFYSSGMKVRLGFSVAAHLEPEILVIDEVLAVGDFEFQNKCLGKMNDVAKSGRTILFVSHNMAAVKSLCNKGLVLEKGEAIFFGEINEAIENYVNLIKKEDSSSKQSEIDSKYVKKVFLLRKEEQTNVINMGEKFKIEVHVSNLDFNSGIHVGLFITDLYNVKVGAVSTAMKVPQIKYSNRNLSDISIVTFEFNTNNLITNRYKADISIAYKSGGRLEFIENAVQFDVLSSDVYNSGVELTSHFGLTYFDFNVYVENY